MAKTLIVNGQEMAFDPPDMAALVDVLHNLGIDPQQPGLATAINGRLVKTDQWNTPMVRPGDRIEIVHPLAGG